MRHGQAIACMVLAAFLWSLGGVVSRHFQAAQGFEVTFWRSLFAALTVAAWLLSQGWHAASGAVRSGGRALWLSGVLWAVMFTCFMVALSLTRVANVLITQSLAPVFTALLASVVLRQPVGGRAWLAVVVAALGIGLMYAFDVSALDGRHALGVLVALGIPVAAAVNWVLVQRTGQGPDLRSAVLVGGLISALATLPLALPFQATPRDLALLAFLGIFQLGIPCVMAVQAARTLSATEVALLGLLEVLFGIVLTTAFGGETPGWATVTGGTAVMLALVYNEVAKRPARPPGP